MNARQSMSLAVFHRLCTEPVPGSLLPPDPSQRPHMLVTVLSMAVDEGVTDAELGELTRSLLVELDRIA